MAGLTNPMPQQPPQASAPAPAASDPSQPGAAPAPGAQPQQQSSGPPLTDGPVDPETYQKVVANCMNTVTQALPTILKSIASSPDKPGALATAAVHVLMRVEDSFEQSGGKLVLTMTFNSGAATLIDISEAAEKAGVHAYSQKELEAAFLQAVDQYRVIRAHQGRIDQAQFQQQLQQMKQDADNGTLEKQFPGLDQMKQIGQQSQQRPQQQPGGAPAPADGDGTDGEAPGADTDTPATDQSEAGGTPADAAPASPPTAKSNDFPAAMLKKREGKPAAKAKAKAKPKFLPKKGGK